MSSPDKKKRDLEGRKLVCVCKDFNILRCPVHSRGEAGDTPSDSVSAKTPKLNRLGNVSTNIIYNEDCLETMKRMPDESIDLVVTSPPYDNLRDYKGFIFDFDAILFELFRVVKEGGAIVWVVGDATIGGSETGTSFRQALAFIEQGFNLHDTMIWLKTGQGAVGSIYAYWQNFEYMFVFSKGRPTFNPIEDRQNVETPKKWVTGGRKADGTSATRRQIKNKPFGKRFNTWRITEDTKNSHPAAFPERLAKDHIISWSNGGDIVYDPFMGSGTTAKAAKDLNRRYIGSEISKEYCEIAEKRLKQEAMTL